MSKSSSKSTSRTPMTVSAASRIQRAAAVKNGGQVAPGTFAARAMSTAALNANAATGSKPGGNK